MQRGPIPFGHCVIPNGQGRTRNCVRTRWFSAHTMETNGSLRNALAGITLRQLQYFVAVAEEEHFTHAAERLVIAQPALSRQVNDLEEALGVALFVRASRGVRLTEAGRELLVRTRAMFVTLERTVDAVRFAGQVEFGRLRLGYYGPSFYNNAVTRNALEQFRLAFPNVDVIAHELFSEQLIRALRDGRIDIGISRGTVRASDIESRVIAIERAVVVRRGNGSARRQAVGVDGRSRWARGDSLRQRLEHRPQRTFERHGARCRYHAARRARSDAVAERRVSRRARRRDRALAGVFGRHRVSGARHARDHAMPVRRSISRSSRGAVKTPRSRCTS